MSSYEPTTFVEPLGYQPVEFLDIPPMDDTYELPPFVAEPRHPTLTDLSSDTPSPSRGASS